MMLTLLDFFYRYQRIIILCVHTRRLSESGLRAASGNRRCCCVRSLHTSIDSSWGDLCVDRTLKSIYWRINSENNNTDDDINCSNVDYNRSYRSNVHSCYYYFQVHFYQSVLLRTLYMFVFRFFIFFFFHDRLICSWCITVSHWWRVRSRQDTGHQLRSKGLILILKKGVGGCPLSKKTTTSLQSAIGRPSAAYGCMPLWCFTPAGMSTGHALHVTMGLSSKQTNKQKALVFWIRYLQFTGHSAFKFFVLILNLKKMFWEG